MENKKKFLLLWFLLLLLFAGIITFWTWVDYYKSLPTGINFLIFLAFIAMVLLTGIVLENYRKNMKT